MFLQKVDVSFSSTFLVLLRFRVFRSDGDSKTLKKTFCKKIVSLVGGWVWDLVKVTGGPSICFGPAPRAAWLPGSTSETQVHTRAQVSTAAPPT
jgi:hypothetical protein